MAFDFTADFRRQDIRIAEEYDGFFLNMGLFSKGHYMFGDLGFLSMMFSSAFTSNRELFLREPHWWRPDLYDWMMKHGKGVWSAHIQNRAFFDMKGDHSDILRGVDELCLLGRVDNGR